MKPSMRLRLALLLALAFVPRAVRPQAGNPLGPEFRVNTQTTNDQQYSSVAVDPSGTFVVVWHSDLQDGSISGIFGQRYANGGVPLGPEFPVNTFTTGAQRRPSVAADAAGNFVVVWQSIDQDGDGYGVFGQRYSVSGLPVGPEFRVNTYTTSSQLRSSVAADPTGAFVVVWYSLDQDGSEEGIFGQRFADSGAPVGPEFRINTYTIGTQRFPAVAADSSGNFIVVWNSDDQDGSDTGIFAQRYASSGAALGPEFRINTYTTSFQSGPSVAAMAGGTFLVAWGGAGGDGAGIFGQRFSTGGGPLGPEFAVSTSTDPEGSPSVAGDAAGNFVVAWQGYDTTGGPGYGFNWGVFGHRFLASGAPEGPEFRVNTYTTLAQLDPQVAADPLGNFVVVWHSRVQDLSADGVFGQRFGPMVPVELTGFGVE